MSDLALAAFAAETGHISCPRRAPSGTRAFAEDSTRLRIALGWRSGRFAFWAARLRTSLSFCARSMTRPGVIRARQRLLRRSRRSRASRRWSPGLFDLRLAGRARAGARPCSGRRGGGQWHGAGVDGEAHRGALEAGGVTVAVLGCGVDRDYLAAHASLRGRSVIEDSWCPNRPGRGACPLAFPGSKPHHRRPRLCCRRSRGAGTKRRADHSRRALEEGREVFAVPGEITHRCPPAATGSCVWARMCSRRPSTSSTSSESRRNHRFRNLSSSQTHVASSRR